jgi:hypothetical protein
MKLWKAYNSCVDSANDVMVLFVDYESEVKNKITNARSKDECSENGYLKILVLTRY